MQEKNNHQECITSSWHCILNTVVIDIRVDCSVFSIPAGLWSKERISTFHDFLQEVWQWGPVHIASSAPPYQRDSHNIHTCRVKGHKALH